MTDNFDIQAIVIGAGVVGLAIARAIAMSGVETIVVDRHPAFGMETSSRNSEVIHAGIYYAPNSLKAKLCVEGRTALYEYLDQRAVPYRRCGKLIIASGDAGQAGLTAISARARDCGVDNLVMLTKDRISGIEPHIRGTAALFSPSTGIVDSHALMQAYIGDLESHGGQFVANTNLERVETMPSGGFKIWFAGEAEPLRVRILVNAAGLWASEVAKQIDGLPPEAIPELKFARGVYFSLMAGKSPFNHLIYPLPDNASLGIHATLDLAGAVRFGPDVEWIDDPLDYTVDPQRVTAFAKSIGSYWPDVDERGLIPAYAGIRPKLSGPDEPPADFRINGPLETGVPGLCCLYGIESPGLTSSLAIGRHVAALLEL